MHSEGESVFHEDELCRCEWLPTSHGPSGARVVLHRNVTSWWNATPDEHAALFRGIEVARRAIQERVTVIAFDIGWRDRHDRVGHAGPLEIHVVPIAPEGGSPTSPPHPRALVRGEDDPLIGHLAACFPHAQRVDIAVAFVLDRGVERVRPFVEDLLERNGSLRLVTGDYFGITEPNGLERLLDLDGAVNLRVFESRGQSFHPKSYLFHLPDGHGIAFVGSSNLSSTALGDGVEWNYRVVRSRDHDGFAAVCDGFDRLFRHAKTKPLTHAWVGEYRRTRRPEPGLAAGVPEEAEAPPVPHPIQVEALAALEATRAAGNRTGLVVLATGLGKTWLSAFDSRGATRVLFVAHRDEILTQALGTFRRIRPDAVLGKFTGLEKAPDADVLFASVQTLGKARHLRDFAADRFDYIVVDEFHHAAARTYRNLLEHFTPRFLLGLTATPDRTDGADLLALCGHNLVFRCDLGDGVRQGLLCAFHYRGVPDDVDYAQIPWRSNRFDDEALTNALATQRRAENAYEQFNKWAGSRTLGFCASQRHADFMARYFVDRGKRAVAVHAGPTSAPRANALEDLKKGGLDIVFSVDMFNEGVDVPEIDTVMMLRPTESRVVWLQQFGRGLRLAAGKQFLRVIDYIGNHRSFLDKPRVLLSALLPGLGELSLGHAVLRAALIAIRDGQAELPSGCEVTYELEAIAILEKLLSPTVGEDDLRSVYQEFRLRHGRRPTAAELHDSGCMKKGVLRKAAQSWFGFVEAQGDLSDIERELLQAHGAFFTQVETRSMERSDGLVLLQALLELDVLPGSTDVTAVGARVGRVAARTESLRHELQTSLAQGASLADLVREGLKRSWSEFLEVAGNRISTRFEVTPRGRAAFVELTRELVEWRLAEYQGRSDVEVFTCRVTRNERDPILMLPDRKRVPSLPTGHTTLLANDDTFTANFAKIAINVMRKADEPDTNHLPRVLRGWFGDAVGTPGRGESVVMERIADGYRMTPRGGSEAADGGLQVGHSYMREDIPTFFGRVFNTSHWRQGFLSLPGHLILLVTLEKKDKPTEHRYADHFESRTHFQWQSQNKTTQASRHGVEIRDHAQLGLRVHLFVRRHGKRGQKAAPFHYCGELRFASWDGEKPITVQWDLVTPLSDALWMRLGPES